MISEEQEREAAEDVSRCVDCYENYKNGNLGFMFNVCPRYQKAVKYTG